MKDGAHVRLVLCVFGLVLLCNHSVHGGCFRVGSKPRDPKGPFLEMRISEFPDKDVIPTGSNVTIVCTSNLSVPDTTKRHFGETYWIPFYFYDTKIGECGGYNNDSEESKTCKHYIINGTRSDSGDYSCQAHNQMGYCTEATRTLTFKDPSVPHFTVHPGHQLNVSNGNAASLACEASGVPRPVITWLKDGRPVSGASVKQVKGSSILTFESVSPIDQGMYWCEARNTEGSNTSSTVNMTVWWKPVFLVHPEIIYIHDSDNVTLSCEAAGFPRPVISWLKNNMSITNATSVQNGSVSSLSFHLVKGEEAAGKYKCVARNSMGETVSTEGALRIAQFASFRRVPSFYLHPESTTTSRDSKVKFTCAAQGFPLPTITWMKDGKVITDDDTDYFQSNYTSVLSIRAVHERHVGRYWCVARSSVLNATSREATLSLKDTRNVSTEIVTEPVGDQPSEVVWIAVGAGVVALLCFAIGVIFLKQKRWHRASYKLNKEMIMIFGKNEGFLPEHTEQDLISQLRDRQPIAEGHQEEEQHNLEEDEAVDHETYLKLMGINRNWEISRERLAITEMKLGGGEFGVVKKGVYSRTDGSEMPVAVKLLKDNVDQTERQALIRELETLVQVGRHPNVVSLVGACTFGEPLCVVIEFVPGGSLDKLLRSSRVENGNSDPAYANIWSKLTERELLRIAADVANGMKHLESKHCVHRDLAARNVLIGPGLAAKVADFGMARDISTNGQYIKTTEGRIPWLWMSMEALRGTCTTKADVWSFGVVLWEITTLGELPYKGVRGVVELHNSLLEGLRLVKPPHCSQEIYDIMLWCWQESPEDRPSFEELRVTLQETLYTKDRTYINVTFFEEQTINETSEATI